MIIPIFVTYLFAGSEKNVYTAFSVFIFFNIKITFFNYPSIWTNYFPIQSPALFLSVNKDPVLLHLMHYKLEGNLHGGSWSHDSEHLSSYIFI